MFVGVLHHVISSVVYRLSEEEVSLEEMASGNSAYLKEDYIKRKFLNTWDEICQLQKIPPTIEIVHDEGAYSGTHYPEINRRVQRILKIDEFPDHMDIYEVVERCNVKHSLGIGEAEKAELSRKVFKEVGRIIKSRRVKDYQAHFGSHLTDVVKVEADPAIEDSSLMEMLTRNLQEGKEKMERLCEEFIVKQEQEGDKGGGEATPQEGTSSSEEEEEEEEEEEVEVEVEDIMAGLEEVGDVDVEETEDDDVDIENRDSTEDGDVDVDVSENEEEEEEDRHPAKKMKLNSATDDYEPVVTSTSALHGEGTGSSACSDSNVDVETVSDSSTRRLKVSAASSSSGAALCLARAADSEDVVIISDSD